MSQLTMFGLWLGCINIDKYEQYTIKHKELINKVYDNLILIKNGLIKIKQILKMG